MGKSVSKAERCMALHSCCAFQVNISEKCIQTVTGLYLLTVLPMIRIYRDVVFIKNQESCKISNLSSRREIHQKASDHHNNQLMSSHTSFIKMHFGLKEKSNITSDRSFFLFVMPILEQVAIWNCSCETIKPVLYCH